MAQLPKILIIEDDRILTELYTEALEGLAIVLVANDSETAEIFFREHTDITAIMCDDDLAGSPKSGVDLVKQFKPLFKGPIAAVSGNNERLLRAGCQVNLRKPVSLAQIRSFVEAVTAGMP